MIPKNLNKYAMAIWKRFRWFSKILSFEDVYQMLVMNYLLERRLDAAINKTKDMLDKDYCAGRSRAKYHINRYDDELDLNGNVWYYALFVIDNVEDDIINKLWFEELGLRYEKKYDVNLVELLLAGYKNKEIAAMLGVHESRVSQMLRFKR